MSTPRQCNNYLLQLSDKVHGRTMSTGKKVTSLCFLRHVLLSFDTGAVNSCILFDECQRKIQGYKGWRTLRRLLWGHVHLSAWAIHFSCAHTSNPIAIILLLDVFIKALRRPFPSAETSFKRRWRMNCCRFGSDSISESNDDVFLSLAWGSGKKTILIFVCRTW